MKCKWVNIILLSVWCKFFILVLYKWKKEYLYIYITKYNSITGYYVLELYNKLWPNSNPYKHLCTYPYTHVQNKSSSVMHAWFTCICLLLTIHSMPRVPQVSITPFNHITHTHKKGNTIYISDNLLPNMAKSRAVTNIHHSLISLFSSIHSRYDMFTYC
jgi:hypothetical protein